MAIEPSQLQQHLELAAMAYGADLALPAGTRLARPAIPAPASHAPPAAATAAKPAAAAVTAAASAVEAPGPATGPLAGPAREAALQALRAEVMPCTRCKLHQGRQHVVFGEGNPGARVLFVGEAPGATEDQTGRPFVGNAGQLLDRILAGAMGLHRSDVYIANINKCRPPGNRAPEPDEVAACLPYLRRQIELVRPEVIVCLGRTAAHNLLGTTEPMRTLRGRPFEYAGVPVVVTWHPAFLLRDASHKRETWEDIKRVNRLLGLPERPAAPPS